MALGAFFCPFVTTDAAGSGCHVGVSIPSSRRTSRRRDRERTCVDAADPPPLQIFMGSSLPGPCQFRALNQSFQALAAPFPPFSGDDPGDDHLARASTRAPLTAPYSIGCERGGIASRNPTTRQSPSEAAAQEQI